MEESICTIGFQTLINHIFAEVAVTIFLYFDPPDEDQPQSVVSNLASDVSKDW
jgi:aspartate carbamoyltransferase regulatory subunit